MLIADVEIIPNIYDIEPNNSYEKQVFPNESVTTTVLLTPAVIYRN